MLVLSRAQKVPCSAVLVLSHVRNAVLNAEHALEHGTVLNAEHALEHGTDLFFHFFALRILRFSLSLSLGVDQRCKFRPNLLGESEAK